MDTEIIYDFLQNTYLPVIIWGTRTAAEICYRVLKKRKIAIAAMGDNNIIQWGRDFHGIKILSAEQIKKFYPNALIVVGSFYYDISDSIVAELQQISQQFSFIRFEQIEYIYEIECLQRNIKNKDKYRSIINNICRKEDFIWKRLVNLNVISEYYYTVKGDKIDDLESVLAEVCGIKTLYLIISANMLNSAASTINSLIENENIGHIVLVLDSFSTVDKRTLDKLSDIVFYAICKRGTVDSDLANIGEEYFPLEFRMLPEELFTPKIVDDRNVITEERIVQSVMQFVGIGNEKQKSVTGHRSRPVHIVQLFNGLANQMLMYLFGRLVEEESGRNVIFDDTILSLDVFDEEENIRRMCRWNKSMSTEEVRDMVAQTREKNSFYKFRRAEIAEVFDIPIRLLSDYFEEEVWKKYLSKIKETHSGKYAQCFPLGQALFEAEMEFMVVRDSLMPDEFLAVRHCFDLDTYIFSRPYESDSVARYLLHNEKTLYYMGIWATGRERDWLYNNRKWAGKQFTFQVDLNDKNQAYAREIQESDAVVVHIRRGDFVCGKMSADKAYFRNAIREAENLENYKNRKYFIFSDDLEWCRKNDISLGIDKIKDRTVYVTGNVGKDSYVDMYLMSLGKISIPTPGSSFGYVATLVSKTMEKMVDIPKYLYDTEHGTEGMISFVDI